MPSEEEEATGQAAYDAFWPKVTEKINKLDVPSLKHQELPLARIKKIMKLDEEVKMISAEAPVLFAKAAEIFIMELTLRAWLHTEDNKRRTLQRNDIAMAITKHDQFDFLIDIVPRDDIRPKSRDDGCRGENASHFPQQPSASQPSTEGVAMPQVMHLQPTQMVSTMTPPPRGIIFVAQILGPNGETQQVPIQLTDQQLQLVRAQVSQQTPLVIQTAPIAAASFAGPTQLQQTPVRSSHHGKIVQLQSAHVFITPE